MPSCSPIYAHVGTLQRADRVAALRLVLLLPLLLVLDQGGQVGVVRLEVVLEIALPCQNHILWAFVFDLRKFSLILRFNWI